MRSACAILMLLTFRFIHLFRCRFARPSSQPGTASLLVSNAVVAQKCCFSSTFRQRNSRHSFLSNMKCDVNIRRNLHANIARQCCSAKLWFPALAIPEQHACDVDSRKKSYVEGRVVSGTATCQEVFERTTKIMTGSASPARKIKEVVPPDEKSSSWRQTLPTCGSVVPAKSSGQRLFQVVQVDGDAQADRQCFWLFWQALAVGEHGRLFEAIAGYGLGSSSIALLGRVGGGICSKAAIASAKLFR